jgi:hypothetical protein
LGFFFVGFIFQFSQKFWQKILWPNQFAFLLIWIEITCTYVCMYVWCRNNWSNTNDLWSYNQDYWKVDMIKPLAPGQNVQLNIMSGNLEFKASWWWDICTRINERMCIRMNMDCGLQFCFV